MYSIVFGSAARRDLASLPVKIVAACVEFIYGPLSENPHRVGKALLPPLDGQHSARRGSYRVVYRIDDERSVVLINRVDHRSDVHRGQKASCRCPRAEKGEHFGCGHFTGP